MRDTMNPLLWQSLITNGFWLAVFLGTVIIFRRELRLLLRAVSRFKLAGASFELRDINETLEYYAVFSGILIEVLSHREFADKFYDFLSPNSVEQLRKFIGQYEKIPEKGKNIELVKNVALLLGRKGNYDFAIETYDKLLKADPNSHDLQRLKARMLRESGSDKNLKESEKMYKDLIERFPFHSDLRFGLARTQARLGQWDASLNSLEEAIKLGYWQGVPEMLDNRELLQLWTEHPDKMPEFQKKIKALRDQARASGASS